MYTSDVQFLLHSDFTGKCFLRSIARYEDYSHLVMAEEIAQENNEGVLNGKKVYKDHGFMWRLQQFAAALLDALPHGSGIDADWNIVIKWGQYFVPVGEYEQEHHGWIVTCTNDFHAMDHAGGYAGWMGEYTLTLWLDDELDIVTTVTRYSTGDHSSVLYSLDFPDVDALQKASDEDYGVTDEDEELYGVYWEGIKEYLQDVIPSALSDLHEGKYDA